MKSDAIMRACYRMEARFLGRSLGHAGWWSPLLGHVMPEHVIAVCGPWPLQRYVLAQLIAGLQRRENATLRGPTAVLEEIVEAALTLRAGLARDMVRVGIVQSDEWQALAMAAGAILDDRLRLQPVDDLVGVELEACARWCFGMAVAHPDIDVEVIGNATGIHLLALDGRTTPPTRRRARLQSGRLRDDDDDNELGEDVIDDSDNDDI